MEENTQTEIKPQDTSSEQSGKGLPHFLSRLRSYLIFDPLVWLYTVVLGSVSLTSSFFDREGRIQHRIARLWAKAILGTMGAKVQIEGLDRIDTSKAHVYVVNHLSALDIPVLYANLPFQFRILAKKELFRYPFMGWHLSRSGQIPVVLENARASMRSLNQAVAAIKNNMSLVIFPEGQRSATGQLQPFLGGAFYAAIKAQADVVPIALVGTYEMLKMNTWHIMPCPLHLVVGEPIPTAGMSIRDLDKVLIKARKNIGDLYYSRCVVADMRGSDLVVNESKK